MAATPSHPLSSLVILLNRLTLGLYLALAGWSKVRGEVQQGLGNFFRSDSFGNRRPGWLPDLLAAPYAYALPWLELILGVLLILGLFGRVTAMLVTLLLLSIGLALLGAGELVTSTPSLHPISVMITLAMMLTLIGPGGWSADALIRRRKVT